MTDEGPLAMAHSIIALGQMKITIRTTERYGYYFLSVMMDYDGTGLRDNSTPRLAKNGISWVSSFSSRWFASPARKGTALPLQETKVGGFMCI